VGVSWREALAVDRGMIDEDHRHLIELINSIELTVSNDRSIGELIAEIEALARYTHEHFAREESIMLAMGYAKYDEHKSCHIGLINSLNEVAKPVYAISNRNCPISADLMKAQQDQLIGLLRHWLLDHIIKEDMKMKPLLSSPKTVRRATAAAIA
jgi:hemerythrin